MQNTLVQWSRSSAVVRGISCPSDERKQARIERGRRRELEAGSFGDKRRSSWKSVTVAHQPSVTLLNSETWLTNTTIMPNVDESRLGTLSHRNQRWPSAEHHFADTLSSGDNDDCIDEQSTKCHIENRAPENSGVDNKRTSSRWLQRNDRLHKSGDLEKMHVCHFASHEDMCVYSVSETS